MECLTLAFSGAQMRKRRGNCYVTHVFSGVTKRRDKIRRGYITIAYSGTHIPKPMGLKIGALTRNPEEMGFSQFSWCREGFKDVLRHQHTICEHCFW